MKLPIEGGKTDFINASYVDVSTPASLKLVSCWYTEHYILERIFVILSKCNHQDRFKCFFSKDILLTMVSVSINGMSKLFIWIFVHVVHVHFLNFLFQGYRSPKKYIAAQGIRYVSIFSLMLNTLNTSFICRTRITDFSDITCNIIFVNWRSNFKLPIKSINRTALFKAVKGIRSHVVNIYKINFTL